MDYHTCPNLAVMFFAEAARQGDRPFLWAKRQGAYRPLNWDEAARQVTDLAKGLRALGLQRGDRVGAGLREPAGMDHRRSRHHGGGRHHRAGLYHPYRRGLPLRAGQLRRASWSSSRPRALAHRVLPAAAQVPGPPKAILIEPPEDGLASHVELRSWQSVLELGASLAGRCRGLDHGDQARRRRLPDLHLGHGRHAQGRDDDAWQHARQLPRRRCGC